MTFMVCHAPLPNRILVAIARTRQRFVEGIALGDIEPGRLPLISLALSLSAVQYGALRDHIGTKLLCDQIDCSCDSQTLSYDEAETLLDILGYSVNHFNKQSIAAKAVVIREFSDIPLPPTSP